MKEVRVVVYGANEICASCVNAPSSKDTFEWLQAAITRKYNQPVHIDYVDIFNPQKKDEAFARKVIEEDMFYPVVVINDEVIEEGTPRLKPILAELEKYGYTTS